MRVDVETRSEFSDGRTSCDVHGVTGRTANAEVGVDLEVDQFWDLMVGALASYAPTRAA
jgi:pyrimidine-specific ribonucleoside hydrolase